MRFVFAVVTMLVLNYVLGLFLPWWIIVFVGFLSGYLTDQTPLRSFLAGFLAGFILWASIAFVIDVSNEQVLSKRIAGLFTLSQPWLMIVITGFIGALVTGLGALTGALLRKLLEDRRTA